MLSQIPITGDTLTAGAMVAGAVVFILNSISETKRDFRQDITIVADSLSKLEREVALLAQRSDIEDKRLQEELDSAIAEITVLRGRIAELNIHNRDIVNWMQSRGANFIPKTGGYAS